MNTQISLGLALVAGLASFLSPCVLPLVPIYLAQLVGKSVQQSAEAPEDITRRLATFLHAIAFVTGFTLSFVALGATASALGLFLYVHLTLLRQISGVILVIMGLHLTGILKIPLLYRQKRWLFQPAQPSYPASLLLGVLFAIAWSPCVGPILAGILTLAASAATLQQGVWLLLIYSLGLGIPFLLLGLGLNQVSNLLKRLKPHLGKIEIATGILLIVVGILIYNNLFAFLNTYFKLGLTLS